MLVVDSIYAPTRRFCDQVLTRFGVAVRYYAPRATPEAIFADAGAAARLVVLESPGSLTFEFQDVAGIAAAARERIGKSVSIAADHLSGRTYLIGDRFTVADAHLAWALSLLRRAGVDVADWPPLADYLGRMQARPQVKTAIETEMAFYKTVMA